MSPKRLLKHLPRTLTVTLHKLAPLHLQRPRFFGPKKEFHVSRTCRGLYQFNQALMSVSGNVIFPDFQAVRLFAQKINDKRDVKNFPDRTIKAGALNAMGLIDEILHYVVALYGEQAQPQVFKMAMLDFDGKLSGSIVRKTLLHFCHDFPPEMVYQGKMPAEEYLLSTNQGIFNREIVLEEILLLWLANMNPAFAPFRELFADSDLQKTSAYPELITALKDFFLRMPPFGPENQDLVTMLRSPALAFPDSLPGQLRYIQEKWGLLLSKYAHRLLSGLDMIQEEEKKSFAGPGQAQVFDSSQLTAGESDTERFSQDREWMSHLVLIAKSIYIWLDQLSKKYGRTLSTLDQIPDEELDALARFGFTGLWLIGVWERSPASRLIKQKCGNPEAIASAYSLFQYWIASDLGGETALQNLKQRAWARGIRLASDMVPNHMGIDSPWVIEHPEWFISLDHSPFPAYTFNGPDLSGDPRVAIYLEDHYYERSDAAVVFKQVDRQSGVTHYIYHGNDGTRMPWNDTAQLDYLRPEVRETVKQTILAVARNFPIIRFDAAMTLTKQHYQRLWFPQPGSGGDIPSRVDQGMSKEQFDQSLPGEFWREVVERVGQEAPDTLLLAEAFWLMEGYFVRSLGMHRVYNSAFMNFLKNEENAQFRSSLKNTLEFNPEILKRFVNFMNNPDEETAVAQFGKQDKYFGVCTLMAALPGLPMFGHGQIEGFQEKYGMEYRRAYWNEQADADLLRRHERQIFPLLKKRYLFSGVDNFLLYDFFQENGTVDENVFAFSNGHKRERCLVVYHNKYAETSGWIRMSVAFSRSGGEQNQRALIQENLAQGLDIPRDEKCFVIFRDLVTQLEYIRNCRELFDKGLYVNLGAFQTHVFLEFKQIRENEWSHYTYLTSFLNGRGVPSLEDTLRDVFLNPVQQALHDLCEAEFLKRMRSIFLGIEKTTLETAWFNEMETRLQQLLLKVSEQGGNRGDRRKTTEEIIDDLFIFRGLFKDKPQAKKSAATGIRSVGKYFADYFGQTDEQIYVFFVWLFVRRLGEMLDAKQAAQSSRNLLDEWLLGKILAGTMVGLGWEEKKIHESLLLIKIATAWQNEFKILLSGADDKGTNFAERLGCLLASMLKDADVLSLLQVHRFRDDLWFNRDAFAGFTEWVVIWLLWEAVRQGKKAEAGVQVLFDKILFLKKSLLSKAQETEYKLELFFANLPSLSES